MLPLRHPGGACSSMENVSEKTSPCLIRREHRQSDRVSSQRCEIAKTKTGTTPLGARRDKAKTQDTGHRVSVARWRDESLCMRGNANVSRRYYGPYTLAVATAIGYAPNSLSIGDRRLVNRSREVLV